MFSYQHHIGDFRRDTASLSDVVAMAYLKLLWMYYDTELPLPADAKLLAFKIGSDAETVQLLLDSFFQLDENVYRHKRCDAEIVAYYSRKTRARDNANKRWQNATASENHAIALLEHSNSITTAKKSHANREPITDNQIYINRFDTFWKQYPRKIAKDNAKKAWLKIKPDDDLLNRMLVAINQQGLINKEIQFVPHPATWLNGKRWEDEVTVKQNDFDMMLRRAK
jgi:uncharacterized protein YdaU (DUF1376 family)